MQIIYIAGPYRGKSKIKVINYIQRQINIFKARQVAGELWKLGYAVICPHSNSANFDGKCDDKIFLEGDKEILKRCDLVVLLPDWIESEGTKAEVLFAADNGINFVEWEEFKNVP
jgi:hypothetical protein